MILTLLRRNWCARLDHATLAGWCLGMARTLRVLAHYRAHRALCALEVYARYAALAPNLDPFHHLSHRHYLVAGLGARARTACVLTHHCFEEARFDRIYKHAVYRGGGLVLWQADNADGRFTILLEMASRMNAEGDLTVSFQANGACLHRLSFSWVPAHVAGLAGAVLPFVARNQGRWIDSDAAFAAFERAFPQNSPGFFCFAALQGMSLALGLTRIVGIKSAHHVAYKPDAATRFANAYDGFWQRLGGRALPGNGYLIALPCHQASLAGMPAKHRKRAAGRRAHWQQIGDAAGQAIGARLLDAAAAPSVAPVSHVQQMGLPSLTNKLL
jgi:hypothetical protein